MSTLSINYLTEKVCPGCNTEINKSLIDNTEQFSWDNKKIH